MKVGAALRGMDFPDMPQPPINVQTLEPNLQRTIQRSDHSNELQRAARADDNSDLKMTPFAVHDGNVHDSTLTARGTLIGLGPEVERRAGSTPRLT